MNRKLCCHREICRWREGAVPAKHGGALGLAADVAAGQATAVTGLALCRIQRRMVAVWDSQAELARNKRNELKRESSTSHRSRRRAIRSSKTARGVSASSIWGSLVDERVKDSGLRVKLN